jgi:hypothetical protein
LKAEGSAFNRRIIDGTARSWNAATGFHIPDNKEEVLMSKQLMEYFNKQPRLGILSTADENGKINSGYFGSPRMIDEKTIFMGLGKNRTFANLQENPHACFLIMEPGSKLPEWKGVRVYLKMIDCQTSGEKLDNVKSRTAEAAGENAAKMIYAAITFEIEEIRPLADFGQGWEKSI